MLFLCTLEACSVGWVYHWSKAILPPLYFMKVSNRESDLVFKDMSRDVLPLFFHDSNLTVGP